MYIDNPWLQQECLRDTIRTIIALMSPNEFLVAWFRADGLNDSEIGRIMEMHPRTVSKCISTLRARVIQHHPDTRLLLSDRRRPDHRAESYTHLGNLSGQDPRAVLTATQAARALGVTPTTIRRWCTGGQFPNATRGPRRAWQIPVTDLAQPPGSDPQ